MKHTKREILLHLGCVQGPSRAAQDVVDQNLLLILWRCQSLRAIRDRRRFVSQQYVKESGKQLLRYVVHENGQSLNQQHAAAIGGRSNNQFPPYSSFRLEKATVLL